MPIENLYRIKTFNYQPETGVIESDIELNVNHPVFEGHFPGNPVLPGVCTLQIAKEVISMALSGTYRLLRASGIKYLGFINPEITPEITLKAVIKPDGSGFLNCNASVNAGEKIVCSFKSDYLQI